MNVKGMTKNRVLQFYLAFFGFSELRRTLALKANRIDGFVAALSVDVSFRPFLDLPEGLNAV